MLLQKTEFEGLFIIEPHLFKDERGYFFESFNLESFEKNNIKFNPVQDNESYSVKGVIRGLHYQMEPFAQSKLIKVTSGKIFDVSLDLRELSKTYKKWFGIILDPENKNQVFIPRGFAHGFSVLSESAIVQYKCDNFYNPYFERSINPIENMFNIDWHLEGINPIISKKDQNTL